MKLFTNSKNPIVTFFKSSEAAILTLKTHVVLKYSTIYRKLPSTCTYLRRFSLHQMRGEHWRKSTNDREESLYRNYDEAFGIILRISKGFHIQAKPFGLFFSSTRQSKHLKTSRACTHKVQIHFFYVSLKGCSSHDPVPLTDGQLCVMCSVICNQILSPWLGKIVDYGIGRVSYRPARLHNRENKT